MSTAMDIAYQEGAKHHVTLPHQTGYLLCRRMRVVHIVMRLSAFGPVLKELVTRLLNTRLTLRGPQEEPSVQLRRLTDSSSIPPSE